MNPVAKREIIVGNYSRLFNFPHLTDYLIYLWGFLSIRQLNRLDGIPARNAKGERLIVFLGIIDILQNYRLSKKIEHALKATIHDGVRLALNAFFWKRANGLTLHL